MENAREIGQVDKSNKTIRHYAVEILPARLADIRLNASTGGLRLVSRADLAKIQNLPAPCDKQEGVRDRDALAMFPDEIEALRKAFEIFS